eukprot:8873850-Lingulodinium_polyedra.AAC.1
MSGPSSRPAPPPRCPKMSQRARLMAPWATPLWIASTTSFRAIRQGGATEQRRRARLYALNQNLYGPPKT